MFDNSPEFLKPRLRLFLSADVVGSTALKQPSIGQQRHEQRTEWFSKIQGFYFEAQKAFSSKFKDHKLDANDAAMYGDTPVLWKTVGDEVLFTKVISDHRQVPLTLHCWMHAVEKMRGFLKKDNSRLDVKCTCWIAGFPFRNSEVAVPNAKNEQDQFNGDWFAASGTLINQHYENIEQSNVSLDFIGPSIDIGFRLSQFCSSRKFVISIEVAYILAIANPRDNIDSRVFSIYSDGSVPLKGVLGGLNYPVFWLDSSKKNSLAKSEDKLLNIKTLNRDELKEYCDSFFQEHNGHTFAPFISNDNEPELTTMPEWYEDEHQKLVTSYERSIREIKDFSSSMDDKNEQDADKENSEIDPQITDQIDTLKKTNKAN